MIIPIILILVLGISVLFSSSQTLALYQLVFGLIGLTGYFFFRWFDYRALSSYIKFAYAISVILLAVTWIIGVETRGAISWLTIGPFTFQPSEFAKPVLILSLGWFWSKHYPSWFSILKSILWTAPIFLLIFIQPDLGTSLTIIAIWLGMLIASNISLKKIALIGLIGLMIIPSTWLVLEDYQKNRIISFVSPESDPQGIGFHVIQSTIAVGSGGIWGRGLGRGTQSRLQFLPEFRTDFIYAFIAEELGFLGAGMILIFYALIMYMIFRTMSQSRDRFGELICIGVLSMMFLQILINIGMNVGLLPITGITLPLLSYGGSSLISTLLCLGLVASVAKFSQKKKSVETFSPIG